MVVESLAAQRNHLDVHFVSNVDGWHLHSVLAKCDPETTLVVVVSKTFTTQETMANAMNAKTWLTNALGEVTSNHFVAVSTNIQGATDFGIEEKNIFGFWDWVGGRYSLWSSVGLTISLACGYENFEELLKGAESADVHFAESSWEKNIPFLMAALGLWYNNYWDYSSHAILPYDQRLHRFPAYLQQADMESNGKSVDRNGERVSHNTGPIIWGECGTNGQHAFYQLIHQGTRIIPCDFILFAKPDHGFLDQHEKLVANCIAQSRALVMGRSREEISQNPNASFDVTPFKVFEGNRPSNTMIFDRLSPYNLGKLISFYEHKIFVQGFFWNVFSYDQWGVELGKILANNILERSEGESSQSQLDSSSKKLLNYVSLKA
jgi:glucose-6-phosphate isomerase